jgi:hypothetical protein
MRFVRVVFGLALLCACLEAQTDVQKVTVMGKLTHVMAIGGESTGWAIEVESPLTIDGKELHSIEVDYKKTSKLQKLENKRVSATGKMTHRKGVETGDRLVLEAVSVKEAEAQ